jgi:formate dehydrogenase (NADP+) beta subunit
MEPLTFYIDGKAVEGYPGETILALADRAGIYIPRLCFHPELSPSHEYQPLDRVFRGNLQIHGDHKEPYEGCRLCLVSVDGMEGLAKACDTEAKEGMTVSTKSEAVLRGRKESLVKILKDHPHACLLCAQREGCSRTQCSSNVPEHERCCAMLGNCELQRVAEYVGIRQDLTKYTFVDLPVLDEDPLYERDYNLCVGCLRCVRMCDEVRGIKALGYNRVGEKVFVGTTEPALGDSGCRFCLACVEVCPTGALKDKGVRQGDREAFLVPCGAECPAGIDVPRYLRYGAEGRYDDALAVIREKVPFPATLGHVCPHPCESVCKRAKVNEPIAICSVKRLAAEIGSDAWKRNLKREPSKNIKVAVIGAGPAGLSAAYFLAIRGYSVTVYEALSVAGGMLAVGIPEYRLPKAVLAAEIKTITDLGVEIKLNTALGRDITTDQLHKDGYKAILMATGAHTGQSLGIPGEDAQGALEGVTFLRDLNLNKAVKAHGDVVVIGGGNVAIDAARSALRLGANSVAILYRRDKEDMPANIEEIEEAEKEGVKIHTLVIPKKIISENGKVAGVECARASLGAFDNSGRRRPEAIPGSEFIVPASLLIPAIGQVPDLSYLNGDGVRVTKQGTMEVDQYLATTGEGIFAAGDNVRGPATVVEAIADGKKSAMAIDKYLGGDGVFKSPSRDKYVKLSPGYDIDLYQKEREKVGAPHLPLSARYKNFDEVVAVYPVKAAVEEAKRCLHCYLREEEQL